MCLALIASNPADPLGHAMLARTLWARVLNNERALNAERFVGVPPPNGTATLSQQVTPAVKARFLEESRKAITLARSRLLQSPADRSALFVLGLAHLNLAAFEYSVNGNIWGAFRNGESAVDAHRRLLRLDPVLGDPHLANGMALYLADVLPWKVKWLAVLLGFQRGREEGKKEIEVAARTGNLNADDARTMLVLLNERDGQLDKARGFLLELHQRYPRNYIVELELAGVEMRLHRFEQARFICRRILAKAAGQRDGYQRLGRPGLYIKLGICARQTGRAGEASAYLLAALDHPARSDSSVTVALVELGKAFDLLGRRSEAVSCYRRAARSPDVSGSRNEALRLMRSPFSAER